MLTNYSKILAYDHMGIRVNSRDVSRAFYAQLGFA